MAFKPVMLRQRASSNYLVKCSFTKKEQSVYIHFTFSRDALSMINLKGDSIAILADDKNPHLILIQNPKSEGKDNVAKLTKYRRASFRWRLYDQSEMKTTVCDVDLYDGEGGGLVVKMPT